MTAVPGIFSLLIGIVGWYYLFYSKAAHRLGGVENQSLNGQRVRLRRFNGLLMVLFAACFYAGFYAFDEHHPNVALFFTTWGAVIVLLVMMIVLALVDLRLTARLRRRREFAAIPKSSRDDSTDSQG